jgi:GT2 family glycosyltransferase
MIDLSIIIVNYNSFQLTLECIHSLMTKTKSISFEIIVVDNDSSDGSSQEILGNVPSVKWLPMGYNAGFARANNAGIKAAGAETVLLLNPDIIITDNSVAQCYERLDASEYVAAGVQLRNPDNSPQISGHYFMKGGFNLVLPLPYWGAFLKWIGTLLRTPRPSIPLAAEIQEVDWISGAFLMVKKKALEKAGLMDEDFFLYAEEVEWCSRIRKQGKLCIYGDLGAIHLQGEAINKDQQSNKKGYYGLYDRKDLQLMVSNHLRVRKQYGVGWFLFLLLNYTWGVLVYAVVGFIHRLISFRNPFGHYTKVVAFGKNVSRIWTLAPTIIRNKPYFYKML